MKGGKIFMLTAKDIKKKLNKIMALGLAALLLLDISSVKAQAAGSSTVSVGIEVQSELS
jgi:hypothetical protein